jgi:DMSO/TMAO reductase YedYZ molybdopterin-dependent catalytic subunit
MTSQNSNTKVKKLPPGQRPIKNLLRWGIDHPGISRSNPKIDLQTYTLEISGEIEKPIRLNWKEILELPKTQSLSDFHCVEGWSVLDCKWEGIRFNTIVELVKPRTTAKCVTFECADGYKTSLSLEELSGEDVLLAYRLNEKPLEEGTGFPLRLVVPNKYAYKSALWVTKIKFAAEKELGFWEKRGYSDTADVWKNDRYTK